jgi:D-glycero-D-manno-heptose 1,7-bisphosphate phosphatase
VAPAPAVFLDRDGVLNLAPVRNGKPHSPATVGDVEFEPGAATALRRLKAAGYRLVAVTNQPNVSRGVQSRDTIDAINDAVAAALDIDEVRVCYHDDEHRCECRKPMPGLLLQEPAHDLPRSFMVGDRWRDIEAGRRAGVAATILIEREYTDEPEAQPTVRVRSLVEAVDWILSLKA